MRCDKCKRHMIPLRKVTYAVPPSLEEEFLRIAELKGFKKLNLFVAYCVEKVIIAQQNQENKLKEMVDKIEK